MQLRSCSAVDSSGPTSIQKQKQHKKNCVSKMLTDEPKAVTAEFNVRQNRLQKLSILRIFRNKFTKQQVFVSHSMRVAESF